MCKIIGSKTSHSLTPSLPPSLSPSKLPSELCHPSPVREGEDTPAVKDALASFRGNSPSLQGEGWQGGADSPDGEGLGEGLGVRHSVRLRPLYPLCLLLLWLLTVHFVRQPMQKLFAESLWDFLFTLLLFTIILRLLPRRASRWVGGVAVGLFALISFVEAFLHQRFRMDYDPTMFSLLAETNAQESSEFLSLTFRSPVFWQTLWPYLLIVVFVPALHYLYKRVRPREWPRLVRHVAALLCVAGVLALTITQIVPWCQRRGKMLDYLAMSQSGQVERVSVRPYYSSPLRLMYSLKYWGLMQQEVKTFAENTVKALTSSIAEDSSPSLTGEGWQGGVASPDGERPGSGQAPSIILVIGESYNKHHAHLYGYDRPTTPNMDKMLRQGSLISFTDVVTPWNITSQVFKWMLSTESIDSGRSWADGVLWPALFRRAGWDVSFITNQYTPSPRQNKIDLSGSFFLNSQPLDSLAFSHRNVRKYQYDEDLLAELDGLSPSGLAGRPSFIILHLIGQHMDARLRVPAMWRKWTAADYASRTDLSEKERQTLADYDNATLYNDHVISLLTRRFSAQDALVVYLSDHGEEVYDFGQKLYGRNHAQTPNSATVRSEYEVPFIVWGSPTYRRLHPEQWQRIRQAAERPFMTDDLCHFLFGLTALPTSFYQPARDPLSPRYDAARPRLLKGKYKPLPVRAAYGTLPPLPLQGGE